MIASLLPTPKKTCSCNCLLQISCMCVKLVTCFFQLFVVFIFFPLFDVVHGFYNVYKSPFFPCNIVMKKLSNMVLTLLSFLASCLLWSLILWCSYIKYKFLNTYRIECEFKNAWKKIKLEYICNWSSNNYSIGSMFPCLESNSPTMVSSSFCDTILLVLIIVTWRY
jgi:hypothetical protein